MPPVVGVVLLAVLLTLPALLATRLAPPHQFLALFVQLALLRALSDLLGAAPIAVVPGGAELSGGMLAHAAFLVVATALLVDTNELGTARRIAVLAVAVDLVVAPAVYVVTSLQPGQPVVQAGLEAVAYIAVGAVLVLAQLGLLVLLLERVRQRTGSIRAFEAGAVGVLVLLLVLTGVLDVTLGRPAPSAAALPAGVLLGLALGALSALPLAAYLELARRQVLRFHATPKRLDRLALSARGRLEALVREQEGVLAERTDEAARLRDEVAELSDALTDALLVVDRDGRVTGANGRAMRLLGSDVRGSLLSDTSPDVWHALVADDESSTVQLVDPPCLVDVRVLTAVTGRRLVLLRDVTEEALRRAEADAAEELAATRAEELGRAKQALFRAASHELRTPVTVLSAGLDTLLDRGDQLDPSRRADIEASLRRQAERLRLLVQDLTDVQRFGGVERDDPPVVLDVVDLVRSTIATAECAARTSLCAPERLVVSTDPTHVVRILDNLLSNVSKYAPEGPVEVRLAPGLDGGFRLAVRDHGPGLPATEHERVFDAFYRVDDAHPQPGTGVGLSLVRELTRLLGGSVHIVTHDGAGLLVQVSVPEQPGGTGGAVRAPRTSASR